jgi:hypothetical protein
MLKKFKINFYRFTDVRNFYFSVTTYFWDIFCLREKSIFSKKSIKNAFRMVKNKIL